MFGSDPSIAPRRFDLSKAAQLLDEAGLVAGKDGRRFGFTISTVETYRKTINEEMFATYRRDLAAIGVTLKVEYIDYAEAWRPKVADKRDFDAAFFGWLPEIPDPDPYNLLHSSQIETGRQNFALYKSVEADALIESAPARNQPRRATRDLREIARASIP